jgi:hypothetical protein
MSVKLDFSVIKHSMILWNKGVVKKRERKIKILATLHLPIYLSVPIEDKNNSYI